jgi:bifunctional UDP-N-acetylglucosamine pyrophosphorylase / glucosamine-1-phosphate N-acetyltransferase
MEAIKNLLIRKGVKIPCPGSVEIGDDVDPDMISGDNVVIHSGCKITGARTLIMPGAKLGDEAPSTVIDCQIGKNVELSGGFFSGSTFLDNSKMGSGAHIRPACLIEEGAKGAHTVGLKQTILFPFVTLGSLINFCDCLMAGGTSEKNHSEVGSSYIHFNFTQNQDKATASLIGDVARGVMIKERPIFLGGQGGMVGPVTVEYGTVIAAGTIIRKDINTPDTLVFGSQMIPRAIPFRANLYANLERIIRLNFSYLANLIALRDWYLNIRSIFTEGTMTQELHKGAVDKINEAINERLKQLGKVAEKMAESIEAQKAVSDNPSEKSITRKMEFGERWPEILAFFNSCGDEKGDIRKLDEFSGSVNTGITRVGKDYIRVIKGLEKEAAGVGTDWLQGIVDTINRKAWGFLPAFK